MKNTELAKLKLEDTILIDIREAFELDIQPKLPQAVHIPLGELIRQAEDGMLPKDKKIITICRSGGRCQMANAELEACGYDTDWIEGGMNEMSKK